MMWEDTYYFMLRYWFNLDIHDWRD